MSNQSLVEKFIYSCSHDLRAPVSSIQGLVRIAEYYPHHEEIHQCLEMIDACTHEMEKRISKLQEYMVDSLRPLKLEPLDTLDLILKVKREFKNQLGACGIEVIAEVPASGLWNMDRESIHRILKQLISNSIAFHDPMKKDRKITVKLELNENGSVLSVSDNGKGIPGEQQGRIFDVFFRGTELSIGAGMGLFLVKSLTEKLAGSVSCESEEGVGTTLRISFPLQQEQTHPANN